MDSLTSTVGAIILMIFATLSSALQCDLTKNYPVQDKLNITVHCQPCRTCKSGKEPERLCGSVIGIDDSIGPCKPCKNGTYSVKDDIHPCKTCRSAKCFGHQIVEGTCPTDKDDASYCLDKCDKGYVMNIEQTACDLVVPQLNTTNSTGKPPTNPTSNPPTIPTNDPPTIPTNDPPTIPTTETPATIPASDSPTNPTTENLVVSNDQQTGGGSRLPAVAIVFIVLFLLAVAVAIGIVVYCTYFKNLETTEEKDDMETTNTGLLSDTNKGRKEETVLVNYSKQEELQETGVATTNVPHCPETSGGFADSTSTASNYASLPAQNPTVSDLIASDTNLAFMSSTPPSPPPIGNDFAIEMPVQSPAMAVALLPQRVVPVRPAQLPPPVRIPPSSIYIPNNFNNPDPTRVDGLPLMMYDKICATFDAGPVGKDWRALAGWLKLSVNEVHRIAITEHKSRNVIQSWESEAGNGIDNFVQILVNHKMTYLAGEINNTRRA